MCSDEKADDEPMLQPQSGGKPQPSEPTKMPMNKDSAADGARVDVEAHIGSKLKALYAEVVNQPVPDRLLELLQKLQTTEGGR